MRGMSVMMTIPMLITRRVHEDRVRGLVFFGNLREQMGEYGFPQTPAGALVWVLQKSPRISRNLQEFAGEQNLGTLCSSSLLINPPLNNKPNQLVVLFMRGEIEPPSKLIKGFVVLPKVLF